MFVKMLLFSAESEHVEGRRLQSVKCHRPCNLLHFGKTFANASEGRIAFDFRQRQIGNLECTVLALRVPYMASMTSALANWFAGELRGTSKVAILAPFDYFGFEYFKWRLDFF